MNSLKPIRYIFSLSVNFRKRCWKPRQRDGTDGALAADGTAEGVFFRVMLKTLMAVKERYQNRSGGTRLYAPLLEGTLRGYDPSKLRENELTAAEARHYDDSYHGISAKIIKIG